MSYILGISAYFHDSAAALVHDGKVIAFAKEERFTHIKHNSVFPQMAIDFCLQEGGIEASDLDQIVFYEEPALKFNRVLLSSLAGFPSSLPVFVKAMKSWLQEKLWVRLTISKKLDVAPDKISCVPHHLSHIAQAFLPSPFRNAAFLTMDAIGEWHTLATGWADKTAGYQVDIAQNESFPHSLGLVYAAFTAFLGFKPNSQEGNTMALAAFGVARYTEQVQKVVCLKDGRLWVDGTYFRFYADDEGLFTHKFIRLFGAPRANGQSLPFDVWGEHAAITERDQYYADIAASIQVVLENIVLELAVGLHRSKPTDAICIAGGVALNAVAIGHLVQDGPYRQVFVAPDPGDAGAAMGAALQYWAQQHPPVAQNVSQLAYLGKRCRNDAMAKMVPHIDHHDWQEYRREGVRNLLEAQVGSRLLETEAELLEIVCDDILQGKIVGWFQGGFETGPRALGNRSILAHPARIDVARRLSQKVKARAAFRPYALSVTEADAPQLFDFGGADVPYPARWMQMVQKVKPEKQSFVKAALHIDHTTRPQVCGWSDNPLYHRLLSRFGEKTGLGALLNTSFNESGYPIVSTPEEALIVFARTEMDTLIIGNYLLQKQYVSLTQAY